jgi:hypothetical protein
MEARLTNHMTSLEGLLGCSVACFVSVLDMYSHSDTVPTFGWQLIRNLVTQLDGSFIVANFVGTSVTVTFPPESRNPSELDF